MPNFATGFWFVIYFAIFTPAAMIYRRIRNDPLRLRRNPSAATYWRERKDKRFRPMTSQY